MDFGALLGFAVACGIFFQLGRLFERRQAAKKKPDPK